jgi:predicted nucleic acid-binding protein
VIDLRTPPQRGSTIEHRDTQIAAVAIARGAALVTRNLRDLYDLEVDVVNPRSV